MAGKARKSIPRKPRRPAPSTQKKRDARSALAHPVRFCIAAAYATALRRRSECRVLELLERTDLDLHGGGLGGEPLLFLREGVDAFALRLGRHIDGGDLQQTRQGERAGALL